jgi:hypothetical protein
MIRASLHAPRAGSDQLIGTGLLPCEDPDAMPTPPGSTPLNAAGVEQWKQSMAVYRTTDKNMPEVAGAPPSDTTAEGAI